MRHALTALLLLPTMVAANVDTLSLAIPQGTYVTDPGFEQPIAPEGSPENGCFDPDFMHEIGAVSIPSSENINASAPVDGSCRWWPDGQTSLPPPIPVPDDTGALACVGGISHAPVYIAQDLFTYEVFPFYGAGGTGGVPLTEVWREQTTRYVPGSPATFARVVTEYCQYLPDGAASPDGVQSFSRTFTYTATRQEPVGCEVVDYHLGSQEDIDALGQTGCNVIEGDLDIGIELNSDITNLDALANLTSVGGTVRILLNNSLTNIDGLANLEMIGGALLITGNRALVSLNGLANLTNIGGDLSVEANGALTNLGGLIKLTRLGGDLTLNSNLVLANVDGLTNLTSIEGSLIVQGNSALGNLDGLASLAEGVRDLTITDNPMLTNLDGLAHLSGTVRYIVIRLNERLANVDGLVNLVGVRGDLILEFNFNLMNLAGLAGLTRVQGELIIQGNRVLDNLDGLAQVSGNLKGLNLSANPFLTDLNGLANITSTGQALTINDNLLLTNVNGLANLAGEVGHLTVSNNASLINLDGLAHLTSVGGEGIEILNNGALSNLSGLASVTSCEGDLSLGNNPTLGNCQGIANLLGWPNGPADSGVAGDITIYSTNGAGCNSVDEILTAKTAVLSNFIERFYTNCLGRPSDEGGLQNWLNVSDTQSSAAVALGFLNSAEFLNRSLDDAGFLNVLYRTLFDRQGDPTGMAGWMTQLAAGKLREMVIWSFLTSPEFKALSDSYGVTAISAADEAAFGLRAFVERFYLLVLGRQPDRVGFNNWLTALAGGSSAGGDIARAFFLSEEYLTQNTSDDQFVETIYLTFFGRDADAVGKASWLNVLAEGQSREYVLSGFINSAEFRTLTDSFGVTASDTADEPTDGISDFVERLYTLVLGRQPDEGGFNNWVKALTNGTYTGSEIARAFFFSPEYTSQNTSDDEFVDTCYLALFDREPDASGKADWLNLLAQGKSREEVLNGFIGSSEFAALAASYGITAIRASGVAGRPEQGVAAERRKQKSADAEPIPVLPMLFLMIFSGILGLLGIRRLAS